MLTLAFYGADDVLIDRVWLDTTLRPAWETFYGFASDSGLIHRVVFEEVGSMALDDLHFMGSSAAVPEPASIALMGLALSGLALSRRRKS